MSNILSLLPIKLTDDNDDVEIIIGGAKVLGFLENTLQRSIKNIANGFSFQIAYDPDERNTYHFDPYAIENDNFKECILKINGKEYLKGVIQKWIPSSTSSGTTMTVEVRSKSGILVDCPPKTSPLSFKNQTAQQIATIICDEFGLVVDFPDGDSQILLNVKREVDQTAADFLQELARTTGFIVNSYRPIIQAPNILAAILPPALLPDPPATTNNPDIVFERANVGGESILDLEHGLPPLLEITTSYDATKRYYNFVSNSQTKSKPSNTAEITDESLKGINRTKIVDAKNIEQGALDVSAKWERGRALADSSPVTVVVDGWRDKNGNTIMENNVVTVLYPKVCIFQKTKYLIENTKPIQSINGKQTELTLVLLQAYTIDEYPKPDKMPWVRPAQNLLDIIGDIINTASSLL